MLHAIGHIDFQWYVKDVSAPLKEEMVTNKVYDLINIRLQNNKEVVEELILFAKQARVKFTLVAASLAGKEEIVFP